MCPAAQAAEDTSYFNIELEMVRIWPKRKDGAWFYVEQAAATSKEKPYRQRVYHVQELNDSNFTSDILTIKSGEALFGAYKDPLLLEQLRMDSVEVLDGCTITLHRKGDSYVKELGDKIDNLIDDVSKKYEHAKDEASAANSMHKSKA